MIGSQINRLPVLQKFAGHSSLFELCTPAGSDLGNGRTHIERDAPILMPSRSGNNPFHEPLAAKFGPTRNFLRVRTSNRTPSGAADGVTL